MGKSSVKNLVLEELRTQAAGPVVVEFTPWQWATQDQVARAFFDEIGGAIGRKDKSAESRRAAAKWRAYAAYLKLGATTLSGIRNLIAGLLLAFGVLGLGISIVPDWFRVVALAIGLVGLVAFAVFTFGGNFGEAFSRVLMEAATGAERGLAQTKAELAKDLEKLPHPILVVMDDIDRLTAPEVRSLFQLVKVNADFPNMVYLLLCARAAVEKALEHQVPGLSGRAFLEKIVQVGFDVPKVERSRVHAVLFRGLDQELGRLKLDHDFDQVRWGNVFYSGLSSYFENLRDVRRFVSTFSFNAQLMRAGDSFEANPIDLIALEVLRLFEPDVYGEVPDAKDLLTKAGSLADRSDAAKTAINDMVEKAPASRRRAVQGILRQLFPPIEWAFGGTQYTDSFRPEWYRALRVCHPDIFDRYFLLAIPSGDVSQADIDRVLNSAGDQTKLRTVLTALDERKLLVPMLDRLESFTDVIDLNAAASFIAGLFDVGDRLPVDQPGVAFISPDMHAVRIIHWLLMRQPDQNLRLAILASAIRMTTGLFLPIMVTSVESDRRSAGRSAEEFAVAESALPELQGLCLEKLRMAAASGELAKHPKLLYILHRWKEWASVEEPKQWVRDRTKTDEGMLELVVSSLTPVRIQGIGDYVASTKMRFDPAVLEEFIDPQELESRLSQLAQHIATDAGKEAIRVALRGIQRKREGKTDDLDLC